MDNDSNKFVLIDGHAMLYRAFFAYPQTLTTASGEMINAVYGFTSILLNVIRDLKPTHMAVSFDIGKTWRHEEFPEYKAHREKMPDELKSQEKPTANVVRALNIPVHVKEGFEADDVIGTLATKASNMRDSNSGIINTIIVTGDMDALQLVQDETNQDGGIGVYAPGSKFKPTTTYTESVVYEKYELKPKQIIELKALAGDSSDNIPGVKGIGKKTATKLLKKMPNIEDIYAEIDNGIPNHSDILKGAVLKRLVSDKKAAFNSKKLVTINTDISLDFDFNACKVKEYDKAEVIKLFTELDFNSLIRKLPDDTFEENVQESLF